MGVDRETKPTAISITIDDSKNYLDNLRKKAEREGYNDDLEKDESKKILLDDDENSFETDEYYYEEADNEIHISGTMIGQQGKSHFYLNIPLSDIVLIDIMNGCLKKLGKLKTAMEALK